MECLPSHVWCTCRSQKNTQQTSFVAQNNKYSISPESLAVTSACLISLICADSGLVCVITAPQAYLCFVNGGTNLCCLSSPFSNSPHRHTVSVGDRKEDFDSYFQYPRTFGCWMSITPASLQSSLIKSCFATAICHSCHYNYIPAISRSVAYPNCIFDCWCLGEKVFSLGNLFQGPTARSTQ